MNYSLPTYFPFHTCSISSLLSLCKRKVSYGMFRTPRYRVRQGRTMRARHGIMGSNTWSATATPRCGQLSPASRKIMPSWKLTSSASHMESPSPDKCIILMSHIRYLEINHWKINYFQLLYII